MERESRFSRALWTIVLTIAVAVVVISIARRPLVAGEGEASGYNPRLTLWVTGAEAGGQASAVAEQAASCWSLGGHSATVGVLSGDSSSAVVDFLQRMRRSSGELLLITSSSLAGIVHDTDDHLLPAEARERADRAVSLLAAATPISVLASDRLTLAVKSDSALQDSSQVLALMRTDPARPLFDVADDAWLQGNLATLVRADGLHGEVPYGVFDSTREALAGLDRGDQQVVVATESAIRKDLRAGRLHDLHWPAVSAAPRGWIMILAPSGLSTGRVRKLRSEAAALCPTRVWDELLQREGLTPPTSTQQAGREHLVRTGIGEDVQMQALARRIMRNYY